jgi:hypothetical protein
MWRLAGTLGLLAVVAGSVLHGEPAERREDWVHRRVRAINASDTEAWRRIPWAASLTAAAAAAKKEGRPLFVFSHEGNIDTGRC